MKKTIFACIFALMTIAIYAKALNVLPKMSYVKFVIGDAVYVEGACCIEKEIIIDILISDSKVVYEVMFCGGGKGLYYEDQLRHWNNTMNKSGCCHDIF